MSISQSYMKRSKQNLPLTARNKKIPPTYQCSHCHCRKRNEELSFLCHLLHRGLYHLAGAFGLRKEMWISKKGNRKTQLEVIPPRQCSQGVLLYSSMLFFCLSKTPCNSLLLGINEKSLTHLQLLKNAAARLSDVLANVITSPQSWPFSL